MRTRHNDSQFEECKHIHINSINKQVWNIRGGVIALTLLVLVLPACTNDLNVSDPTSVNNVTIEKVAEEANELIGQTITVRSEAGEEITPATFTIRHGEFFGDEETLVVNSTGKPFVLPQGNDPEVQVTGKVVKFVVADIEREYGLSLNPNLYAEYENKPAIIAKSVSVALAPETGEITNLMRNSLLALAIGWSWLREHKKPLRTER